MELFKSKEEGTETRLRRFVQKIGTIMIGDFWYEPVEILAITWDCKASAPRGRATEFLVGWP